MNAEIRILIKSGIDRIVYSAVLTVLAANPGIKLSSNEIFNKLPSHLQARLNGIASTYTNGPCSKAAAYVGSVASDISNTNTHITHDYSYFCPILNRMEDGFVWI